MTTERPPLEAGPLVRRLEDLSEADLEQVGGKAQSLGVLTAAGFRVPRAFVLTTDALAAFVAQAHLSEPHEELEAHLRDRSEVPPDDALRAFREALLEAPLPEALHHTLTGAYDDLFPQHDPVAVRSSGTREDLEGASFAGQYETYLDVRGTEAVERAIKACWASLWQPRVLEYALRRGGGAVGLRMSVVVQEMIDAEVAGVLFTVNPLTGSEQEVLVEAVHGLGEALVSGRVTGDRYVVDAHTHDVRSEAIAEQAHRVVCTGAGVEEQPLTGEAARAPALSAEQLRELARLSGDIQEHYGRPMDVEWAYANGELAVLQARPITRLTFAPDVGEWTTADFRDGGVSSDVCSPFMWSLYDFAIQNSMPRYFKALRLVPQDDDQVWGRMFFGRPYWNLGAVKQAIEKLPGYSEESFHADLGVDVSEGFEGRTTPTTVIGVLQALPTLFALLRSYNERLAANEAFAASFAERKAPFDLSQQEVAALPRDVFVERFDRLLNELYHDTETGYFTTIFNTSNAKLDLKPVFEKVNQAAGGTLDEPTLLGGLTDLSHLRPMKHLHRLAGELASSGRHVDDDTVIAFAQRWRHHGRKELDIRVPRWPGDLGFVQTLLENAVASYDPAHDPERLEQARHAQYLTMREQALRALRWRPLLRRSFVQKLERVRRYAWWREEMRDHSSFAYYLVRLWAVDAGRRLATEGVLTEADDIWCLAFAEALQGLRGQLDTGQLRERVRSGGRLMRSFRNYDNPNEIGTHFRYPEGTPPVADGDVLQGTACSPGRVTARARVVRSLDEAGTLEAGDILITVFTDPGWTPMFSRIAAVVTETGGVLSHAAVISREYGIPAVLAVPGATRAIEDGQVITVDGFAGTVELTEGGAA